MIDAEVRHRILALAGVPVLSPPEDDEQVRVLLCAMDEFRAWDPADHPRNPKGAKGGGRFRSTVDKLIDALKAWSDGGEKGDPFEGFDREPLRKAAKERGITLKRGASRDDIVKALKADLKKSDSKPEPKADKPEPKTAPAKKAVPKPPRQAAKTVKVPMYAPPADLDQDAARSLRALLHLDSPESHSLHAAEIRIEYAEPDSDLGALVQRVGPITAHRIAREADAANGFDRFVQSQRPEDPNIGELDDLPPVTSAERDRVRAQAAEALRQDLADRPVAVRVKGSSLAAILDSGGFKNVEDTGQSGSLGGKSSLYKTRRRRAEAMLFGIPEDAPGSDRPIYGYAPESIEKPSEHGFLSQYGDVQVVLKPHVRERTTISVGDSIDSEALPSPIDDPTWDSFNGPAHLTDGFHLKPDSIYAIEAQIHGGVGLDDIENVVFNGPPPPALAKRLDALGIRYRDVNTEARHRVIALAGVPVIHPPRDVLDAESRALLTALDEWRAWDPAKHPKGADGKFIKTVDILVAKMQEWFDSDFKGDNPLKDFDREPLRKVAKAKGYELKKGVSHADLVALLSQDLLGKSVVKKPAPKAAKAAPPKAKPPVPAGIGHLSPDLKKSIFSAYKAQPQGQLLSSPASQSYDNLVAVAHVYGAKVEGGLSVGQAAQVIDEHLAGKLGVADSGELHKKITEWLKTPAGAKYAKANVKPKSGIVESITGEVVLPDGITLKKGQKVQPVSGPGAYSAKLKATDFRTHTAAEMQALQDKHMKDAKITWDADQTAAIKNYTAGGYIGMNSHLRSKDEDLSVQPPLVKKQVVHLQSTMMPIPEHTLLLRGADFQQLPKEFRGKDKVAGLKGKTLPLPEFWSTSVAGSGGNFPGQLLFKIEAPAGTHGVFVKKLSYHPSENEMVLAAGNRYRVLDVDSTGYPTVIRLRVVTPK